MLAKLILVLQHISQMLYSKLGQVIGVYSNWNPALDTSRVFFGMLMNTTAALVSKLVQLRQRWLGVGRSFVWLLVWSWFVLNICPAVVASMRPI